MLKPSVNYWPAKMPDCVTENGTTSKTYYSIEVPGVLRSKSEYNVAVSLFEATEPCELSITIRGVALRLEKRVEMQPMSTSLLKFEIPHLKLDEEYFLGANSLRGIDIKEKIKLIVKQNKPLVYIQCDKQAYKRGDNVDYRVIFLEPMLLRPAKLENSIEIVIEHADNIIWEHSDIQVNNGLHISQWHIPQQAIYGHYKIKVLLDGTPLKSKSFEVIDFMPPKFEIKILTARNVPYAQRQLNVGVEAKYADGAPVNGNCKMEFECVGGFFSGIYIEKSMLIIGKVDNTIVDLVEDLKIDNSFMEMACFSDATVMVKVTIFDESTGNQEVLTELVTVLKQELPTEKSTEDKKCCEINGKETDMESIEKKEHISIIPPKKNATIGEIVDFSIEVEKPTKYCVYFLVARGNIVKSELVNVEDYKLPIVCNLEITFQLVPKAFILAYFIHDGVLYFDEVGFNLSNDFENKLTITAPETFNPGDVIPIEFMTAPNSLIGIMGVDKKSVLLNATNDLEVKDIFDDLYHVRSQTAYINGSGIYPGVNSGLVSLSNANFNGFERDSSNDCSILYDPEHMVFENYMPRIDVDMYKKDIQLLMQEREQVFGNWLFQNRETDEKGYLKLEATLPKNPTTWLLTAFAVSKGKGFTMTKEPLRITTSSNNNISEPIEHRTTPIALSKVDEFVVDNYKDGPCSRSFIIDILNDVKLVELSISITENLFGPTIAKLADHAGVMYCTGHLHMTTFIPNVNVLEYLDHLNQLDSDFAKSIKNRFPAAIERELSQRRERDGSFGWFGSDPTGSPHITSLALQAFQRVSKYVDVDPAIIDRGLAYLVSKQLQSGEIAQEEDPFEYPFEENTGVGLTAMVLLAFLQNEEVKSKFRDFIIKAFNYVIENIESINGVYDLAVTFYAMQLAKHSYASKLKERLYKIAKKDLKKNYIWWSNNTVSSTDLDQRSSVSELEVTSYILLGLLETEPIESLLPIIKWMLPTGDFANESMDRAVALDAILKMAAKSGAALACMDVNYTAFCPEGTFFGSILLTPENSSHILTQVLPLNTKKVELITKDKGTFFGNITYRYRELKDCI